MKGRGATNEYCCIGEQRLLPSDKKAVVNQWEVGFADILHGKNPALFHRFLFQRCHCVYLFCTFMLITAMQFVPFMFQQLGQGGALKHVDHLGSKILVAFCQCVLVRFS